MKEEPRFPFAWEPCLAAAVRAAAQRVSTAHDLGHVARVVRLARALRQRGAHPAADLEIVIAAAWCHDLGRFTAGKGEGKGRHAERSAVAADELLDQCAFPLEKRDLVRECLRRHSWRSRAADGDTVPDELQLLRDADALDALGAIGIARAFAHAGERRHAMGQPEDAAIPVMTAVPETTFGHFAAKLLRIPDHLYSAEARPRRAADRLHAALHRPVQRGARSGSLIQRARRAGAPRVAHSLGPCQDAPVRAACRAAHVMATPGECVNGP